jgi:hypothetical protein
VNIVVDDHSSRLTRNAEAKTCKLLGLFRSREQRKPTSRLYFVQCTTQLIETLTDTTGTVAARQFGKREVTLVHLSFTSCDIWIAMPGGGVTLEGGTNGTFA